MKRRQENRKRFISKPQKFVPPPLVADLEVVQNGPAEVIANESIDLTITVTNNGPNIATGVKIYDLLDPTFTYVSNVSSQGVYSNYTGIWEIGTIPISLSSTLIVTVIPTSVGTVRNCASVYVLDQINASLSKEHCISVTVLPPIMFQAISTDCGLINETIYALIDFTNATSCFCSNPEVVNVSLIYFMGDGKWHGFGNSICLGTTFELMFEVNETCFLTFRVPLFGISNTVSAIADSPFNVVFSSNICDSGGPNITVTNFKKIHQLS